MFSGVTRSALASALLLGSTVTAISAPTNTAGPNYVKDVAPILLTRCLSCHQGNSDISLQTYELARKHARAIAEQVQQRAMPPWPADPAHSLKFRNDARLTEKEIATLVAWVDAGTPEGHEVSPRPVSSVPVDWQFPSGRKPDAIVALPEYRIPANGVIPYVQQLIEVPFSEDKWIVAMQLRAGNSRVLHHMGITEVKLPEGVGPSDLNKFADMARKMGFPDGTISALRPVVIDPADANAYDMLGIYTPGSMIEIYGEGAAKLLKGGRNRYISFNIHYTATGKPETDQSELGLWFQEEKPKNQLFRVPAAADTLIVNGRELLTDDPGTKAEGTQFAIPPIPAFGGNYEIIGVTAYPYPVTIFQLQPHAHMRARDFEYIAVYPDGHEVTMLTVPDYDFHSQLAYELDVPLELPAGSKLVVVAHYENTLLHYRQHGISDSDPGHNCGPDNVTYFKRQNQSWDEMFSPMVQYSVNAVKESRHLQPLPVVSAIGCLVEGHANQWSLLEASAPNASQTQTTSAAELRSLVEAPLGALRYDLVGTDVFNPSDHAGHRMAVKGILLRSGGRARLNVTSLQEVAAKCR